MTQRPPRKPTTGVMAATLQAPRRGVMTPPFSADERHLFQLDESFAGRGLHHDVRLTLWAVALVVAAVILLAHATG
jgi:hypothetical protein